MKNIIAFWSRFSHPRHIQYYVKIQNVFCLIVTAISLVSFCLSWAMSLMQKFIDALWFIIFSSTEVKPFIWDPFQIVWRKTVFEGFTVSTFCFHISSSSIFTYKTVATGTAGRICTRCDRFSTNCHKSKMYSNRSWFYNFLVHDFEASHDPSFNTSSSHEKAIERAHRFYAEIATAGDKSSRVKRPLRSNPWTQISHSHKTRAGAEKRIQPAHSTKSRGQDQYQMGRYPRKMEKRDATHEGNSRLKTAWKREIESYDSDTVLIDKSTTHRTKKPTSSDNIPKRKERKIEQPDTKIG